MQEYAKRMGITFKDIYDKNTRYDNEVMQKMQEKLNEDVAYYETRRVLSISLQDTLRGE
jgi:hypothetical protein